MSWILKKILRKLNAPVRNKALSALRYVSSNRDVQTVDTLIIGDMCPNKLLREVCSLDHSVKLVYPDRSLSSSKRILSHLTSLLPQGGNVVIVDRGSQNEVTPYDYPFLSQLARLELNIKEESKKIDYPLFFMPWQSLRLLFGISDSKLSVADCPDRELKDLCNRKSYNLIYLAIN